MSAKVAAATPVNGTPAPAAPTGPKNMSEAIASWKSKQPGAPAAPVADPSKNVAPRPAAAPAPVEGGEIADPAADLGEKPDSAALTRQFAALSRKTKVVHEREGKVSSKEQALDTREKALAEREAKIPDREAFVKLADENPEGFLDALGIDPKKFLLAIANPRMRDPKLAEVEKKLAEEATKREAIEKERAEEKTKAEKAAEEQAKREQAARRSNFVTKAAAFIAEKPEEFEELLGHDRDGVNGPELITMLVETHYSDSQAAYQKAKEEGADEEDLQKIQKGATLSLEAAAKTAEAFLREQAQAERERLSKRKWLSAVAPQPAPTPTPAARRPAGSAPAATARPPTLTAAAPVSTGIPESDVMPEGLPLSQQRAWIKKDTERRRNAIMGRNPKRT